MWQTKFGNSATATVHWALALWTVQWWLCLDTMERRTGIETEDWVARSCFLPSLPVLLLLF